jgi:hypothetical protein
MTSKRRILIFFLLFPLCAASSPASPGKEFLTDKEIEMIQDNREIDKRTKIYMDAAALRLKTAEERLTGKEPEPGDALEFFTPEDMLEGYFRMLKSIMLNLDEAAEKPGPDKALTGKALKHLKSATEKAGDELNILKKLAEEKKKEELWRLVNDAIEITSGAHEGAVYGISKQPAGREKEAKKKNKTPSLLRTDK